MAWTERHAWLLFGVFTVLFLTAVTSHAGAKPFWHDEIVTLIVAGQPTLRDVGAALADGADYQPPLNILLTRASTALLGVGPVPARIPAMAGVWIGCLALFVMVRRRAHALAGLAAAIVVCESAVFRFAYETRGYGLLFGGSAVATWAWAEAAGGRRRPRSLAILALAVGAMLWAHYYAVLILVPMAAAEAVRAWRSRSIDRGIIAAVGTGLLALVPLWPLTEGALARAGTFWARAADQSASGAYVFPLGPLLDADLLAGLGIVALVAVVGAFARRPRLARALPVHEVTFIIVALAIPLIGLGLGHLAGGFTPRYGLGVIVGVALAVPLAAWQASRRLARADLVLAGILAAAFALIVVDARRPERSTFTDPCDARPVLRAELAAGRTVAVTGGLTFLQLWYYCPSETHAALVYVGDPDEAVRVSGSDTLDRGLVVLSRWAPMTVLSYEGFLALRDEVDVYAFGSGWLLGRLEADARLVVERLPVDDPGARLFRVHRR